MNNKKKDIQFEKALNQLEEIVEKLESGELSLEESLNNFSEGVKLINYCRNELNKAEEKVEEVLKDNKGEFGEVVSFDDKEE
ncbi:MAG: exodeoxyribonuclease VII small subunit [Bacillota bacterium]